MSDESIAWTPTDRSVHQAQTSRVLAVRPDELRIEQQLDRLLYHWLRMSSLFCGIAMPVLVVVLSEPHELGEAVLTGASAFAMFVVLLALPLYYGAVFLDNWMARSCVFERETGRFRRTKRDGTVEAEAELDRVHAVQFLVYGPLMNLGQLNLVLDDGERVHVCSGPRLRRLRKEAAELAEWLGMEVLELDDSDEDY